MKINIMNLSAIVKYDSRHVDVGFLQCYKNNEYKPYEITSIPRKKETMFFTDNTGNICSFRVSDVFYFEHQTFVAVEGCENVLDFIKDEKEKKETVEKLDNITTGIEVSLPAKEHNEKKCSYCNDKATTYFSFKQYGGKTDVCSKCETKLRYQEYVEMNSGDFIKFEDITDIDLQRAGLY